MPPDLLTLHHNVHGEKSNPLAQVKQRNLLYKKPSTNFVTEDPKVINKLMVLL